MGSRRVRTDRYAEAAGCSSAGVTSAGHSDGATPGPASATASGPPASSAASAGTEAAGTAARGGSDNGRRDGDRGRDLRRRSLRGGDRRGGDRGRSRRDGGRGRCRSGRRIQAGRLLDVRGRLAELADALAERGPDIRELPGTDDDQRDDQDDDQLNGSEPVDERHDLLWTSWVEPVSAVPVKGVRVAQRGSRTTRRRPAARRSPGSAGRPSPGASSAARAMPRDTLTSSPAAGPAAGRRCRRGTVREHGGDLAALRADPGDEERESRRERPDGRHLGRRRGADHQPDRCPRAPGRDAPGDSGPERLRRVSGRGVRGDLETLELGGARVGGPAQDVGEPVRALEQGGDGLLAQVGVDGDGIGAERVEQGGGLFRCRGPDVATLGVRDERARPAAPVPARAPAPRSPPSRAPRRRRGSASRPPRAGSAASRIRREKASTPASVAGKPAGSAAGSGSRPTHSTERVDGRPRGEPLEVGGGHGMVDPAGASVAAGIWSAGTNQSGRDRLSSPALVVRSTVLPTVQPGAEPSSWANRRSTTCPATCRNASWLPAGDQVGPQLSPSPVTLRSSPAGGGVEDHDVRPERAGPGRGEVPAVRRVRRVEVAGARQRLRLLGVERVDVDAGGALGAVAIVAHVRDPLAVRPPRRVLVAERRDLVQGGGRHLLALEVEQLERDVAARSDRAGPRPWRWSSHWATPPGSG